MIYKQRSQRPGHVNVVFELPADLWADRIYLVGDFNQWNPTATPLTQERDGSWRTSVDLPTHSRHQYHFLVDGRPLADCQIEGDKLQAKITSTLI